MLLNLAGWEDCYGTGILSVGRSYAGVLGLLAFGTVLARGLGRMAGVNATLWQASMALFVFALVGLIVGAIANRIVEESVRSSVAAEAAALQANKKKAAA